MDFLVNPFNLPNQIDGTGDADEIIRTGLYQRLVQSFIRLFDDNSFAMILLCNHEYLFRR